MAADAVAVEPVSASLFPANREENREFNKIGTSGVLEIGNNAVVTGVSARIRYSGQQGIISAKQGMLAREQGI
jgi:hypothetical protein